MVHNFQPHFKFIFYEADYDFVPTLSRTFSVIYPCVDDILHIYSTATLQGWKPSRSIRTIQYPTFFPLVEIQSRYNVGKRTSNYAYAVSFAEILLLPSFSGTMSMVYSHIRAPLLQPIPNSILADRDKKYCELNDTFDSYHGPPLLAYRL